MIPRARTEVDGNPHDPDKLEARPGQTRQEPGAVERLRELVAELKKAPALEVFVAALEQR